MACPDGLAAEQMLPESLYGIISGSAPVLTLTGAATAREGCVCRKARHAYHEPKVPEFAWRAASVAAAAL